MISVIIPTYNRVSFLEKSILSVLSQTMACELIVVDDGSTDNTAELVKSLGRDIVYLYQENRGAAAARNTGIKAVSHDLVAFLDSDDWFDKKKLELQSRAMDDNPDYLISHTQEIWYRRGKLLNQKKKHVKENGWIYDRCLELCAVGMSTIMARKELFAELGLFDEELPCCEDYDLWLRASVSYPFLLVDHPLTFKDGGRPDQLSVQYRVGMDKFRIQSIFNLIKTGGLDDVQLKSATKELVRKCRIYGNGCLKHGREQEGRFHLDLAEHYSNAGASNNLLE